MNSIILFCFCSLAKSWAVFKDLSKDAVRGALSLEPGFSAVWSSTTSPHLLATLDFQLTSSLHQAFACSNLFILPRPQWQIIDLLAEVKKHLWNGFLYFLTFNHLWNGGYCTKMAHI